ncbi:MAG: matrixin family metalloprotease [Myxococcales bacterium]|nr:matrixin family metalloprotease [Myxococcales bacterium]
MACRVAALSLLTATAAGAYELKRDSTGSEVRWQRRAEFVIDRGAALLLDEPLAFASAQAAVEAMDRGAPSLSLALRAGETSGVGYDFDQPSRNQSELVFPAKWEFDKGAIAVTVVTVDLRTHSIIDADIAFNPARKFKALPKADPHSEHDDVQNTLTHELGHALGLAHNPDLPEAVMFPLAKKGEVNKRSLSRDDSEGLAHLYAALPEDAEVTSDEPPVGCSQAGASPLPWALWLVLALGVRAGRAQSRPGMPGLLTVIVLLAPALALASPPRRADAPVSTAAVVATGEIVSSRTLPPVRGGRLLWTEVVLQVRQCLKGSCAERITVRVPGGRYGHLEQLIDGQPLPAMGEVAGIVFGGEVAGTRLYRLGDPADFLAFARGLALLPGSPNTSRSRLTLSVGVKAAQPLALPLASGLNQERTEPRGEPDERPTPDPDRR